MFRAFLFLFVASATFLAATPRSQPFRRLLVFEPNRGQAPEEVKWLARGPGYQLFLTSDGVTVTIPGNASRRNGGIVRMKLEGSRPWNHITGLDPTGGISNYLQGHDVKTASTGIPHYARVRVAGVYAGIDLAFYSHNGDLEYDFVVKPGADPRKIRLSFEGQNRMHIDEKSGELVLTTEGGPELRQVRPEVYQQIGERRVKVAGDYRLMEHGRAVFVLGSYDQSRPLVIDPTISFVKFLAGSGWDVASAVAVDSDGNSYVTGATHSTNFPTKNAFDPSYQECAHDFGGFCTAGDGFVTKLSPKGDILFSTYFGSGAGFGIAVDSTGVVVGGSVFPGSDPDTFTYGRDDGYVLKLSLTGTPIFTRVYFGADTDVVTSVAFDSQHAIWVAGYTFSKDFVGQRSARTTADVFVAKLGPAGERLFTQTWGSPGYDSANGIAVDPADQPWVTGTACGQGFPVTGGALDLIVGCHVFVLQLERTGNTRMSMVFGGSDGGDAGTGIVTNGSNAAYVTGYTHSPIFPTTVDGFQTVSASPGSQAFVTEVDSSTYVGRIVHSTLLGADGDTFAYAIASADAGSVYIAGSTSSSHFPGAPALTPNPTAGFVSKFSFNLSQLESTTLLGAEVLGVAARKSAAAPSVLKIFAAGDRYTGTDLDAFVVKLNDAP